MNKIINVLHNKKKYVIIQIKYKNNNVPILVDDIYANMIRSSCYDIKCDNFCRVKCIYNNKKINLPDIIIKHGKKCDIRHINNIGLDNRLCNLKVTKKTLCSLPKNISNLPSNIIHVKSNKIHGDKFKIKLDNYSWESTSSRKITTNEKLEQARKHLVFLRRTCSDKFTKKYMDEIDNKRKLINSFYKIIYKAGFRNIKKLKLDCNCNIIDKTCTIQKTRVINSRQKYELPKHTFYRKPYKNHGSFFAIENHPNLTKIWRTTTSKKISDSDKYKELINFYNSL